MDNYKETFLKKIAFIMKVVEYFNFYKAPKDWWDVAVIKSSKNTKKHSKVNGWGTTFTIKRLDEMFKEEYERTLQACGVEVSEDSRGIYFRLKDA